MKKYMQPTTASLNLNLEQLIAASDLQKHNEVGGDQLTREKTGGWNSADWTDEGAE